MAEPRYSIEEGKRVPVSEAQAALIDEFTRESEHWEWLKTIGGRELNEAARVAYSVFVEQPITQYIQGILKAGWYTPGPVDEILVRKDSPEARLVQRLQNEGYDSLALFVFIMSSPKRRKVSCEYPELLHILEDPRFDYERYTAVSFINEMQGINSLAPQAGADSVSSAVAVFRSHIESSKGSINHAVNSVQQEADISIGKLKGEFSQMRRMLERRKELWKKHIRKVVSQSRGEIAAAQNDLKSARDAYSAQIDLKESVKYWEERRSAHERQKNLSLVAAVCSMIATFVGMICYLRLEGSGSSVVSNVGTLGSMSTDSIAGLISHFLGAALLLTFLGILIRIALRQYNTHSNCALEAQERMTFTKTYLALMHEGKLSSEADRRLVLEALFKPNTFSNSPEITFTTPLEMIYKAADRSK
ncbi:MULTISPECIES: DUF6161 domain-containing protein [Pseudomonas]|uniref:DUF6161 domain-containing protein n=1 Tax=Pseudomonas sp. FW305-E2 TaxID=2075558 RepID=UPI00117B266B|nr:MULTISPECIES: DUF6161 domain-containing protein [Pseudomonas]